MESMWIYQKMLQYPINIKSKDARLAKAIISQFGGPDGELGASTRYLTQRYAMPDRHAAGLLNDIGTEEMAHFEMVGAIVRQLTRGLSAEELKRQGFGSHLRPLYRRGFRRAVHGGLLSVQG